jgi:hypothetical protein
MKRIAAEVEDSELVVRHLSPGGVSIGIQFTSDLEPRCGCGGPDQIDHHFMTHEWLATPVLGKTALEFYNSMMELYPKRLNPSALWFWGARILFPDAVSA